MRSRMQLRNWHLWLLLSAAYALMSWYNTRFILTEDVFYNTFGKNLTSDRIADIIKVQGRLSLFGFCFMPLVLGFKFLLVSGCLMTSIYFSNHNISFRQVMRIVLVSEVIFILYTAIKLLDFTFWHPSTLQYMSEEAPLSLFSLVRHLDPPKYCNYVLQTINVFELTYFLVLGSGIATVLRIPFKKSILFVLGGYGIGLLLWILIVTFIQLQAS